MAKRFDPSALPAADQAAYTAWQQQAQSYLQGGTNQGVGGGVSVGGLPAELSYVLVHPEYLKQHPELQEAYDTLTGKTLPPSVRSAMQQQLGGNINFDWSGGQAGVAKHKGIWSQPETWIQIALGGALGGAGAAGALGGAGGGAGGGGPGGGGGASGGGLAVAVLWAPLVALVLLVVLVLLALLVALVRLVQAEQVRQEALPRQVEHLPPSENSRTRVDRSAPGGGHAPPPGRKGA